MYHIHILNRRFMLNVIRVNIWIFMSFLARILSVSSLSRQSSWCLSLTDLIWICSIQPTCRLIPSRHNLSLISHLILFLLLLSQLSWSQVEIIDNICDICNSAIALSSTNIVHLLWITWLIIILLNISTGCLEAFNTLFLLLLLLKFLIS